MTKELYPNTPEREDQLGEIVDSFFDKTQSENDNQLYSPEEIGGFAPIGTYSDGSPRYYGDKDEYSHLPDHKTLENNFTESIKNNDPESVHHFSEYVRAEGKHLKLIEQMKEEGIQVHPSIEATIQKGIKVGEAEAGKFDNIPVENLTNKYNYLDRSLKNISGNVELRIQERDTRGIKGQDPFEINIYQKNRRIAFLGTVPSNTGKKHIDAYFGGVEEPVENSNASAKKLSDAIYKNDHKEVKELIQMGVKPNENHSELIKNMAAEKMALHPNISNLIKDNLPAKNQKKGMSI